MPFQRTQASDHKQPAPNVQHRDDENEGRPLSAASLELRVAPERDRVRVIATGQLTATDAPSMESELLRLLDSGFHHVVIDLRKLSFIDTHGLGVLLRSEARARELQARLELLCRPGSVAQLLHRTGLAGS